jgi:hypothetical protein
MTFEVIVRSRKRAPAVAVELEDPSAVKRYFNDVMSNCLRNFELTCHREKAIGRARRQLLSLKESDFYRRLGRIWSLEDKNEICPSDVAISRWPKDRNCEGGEYAAWIDRICVWWWLSGSSALAVVCGSTR